MKIGIIGAENSHTAAIAKLINVEQKIKGFSVDYVWGETDAFALPRKCGTPVTSFSVLNH
jgi:hypothetical protein